LKPIFDSNELLKKFDREIFENVIDKVIIGKVDDQSIRNPYSVTFIFKTGLELEEDCTVKKPKGIHNIKDDIVYSYNEADTHWSDNSDDEMWFWCEKVDCDHNMLWFKTDFGAKIELKNAVFCPLKISKNIDDIGNFEWWQFINAFFSNSSQEIKVFMKYNLDIRRWENEWGWSYYGSTTNARIYRW